MRLFFSEFKANYEKYNFPYQVWLLKEEGDELEKVYNSGFLPMRNLPNVYYLSRNIRIDLLKFELSSENRRILKKTEEFEADLIHLSDFTYSAEVQKLCKDYSDNRFGKKVFSTTDIKNIFQNRVYNNVFVSKNIKSQEQTGYAVCNIFSSLLQYGHSFYKLENLKDNLGARMILEAIIWAKNSGKQYAYLGTCYEESALYKTEFKGAEFFNGFRWSDDLEELKELIKEGQGKQEETEEQEYLLKRKEFLQKYYEGDIESILSKYGVRVTL